MPTLKTFGFVAFVAVLAGSLGALAARSRSAPDAALADSLGESRFIEPRLSGDLPFASCKTPDRENAFLASARCATEVSSPEVARALARLNRLVVSGSDPESRHLAALATVAGPSKVSDLGAAVRRLSSLAETTPNDPGLLNGLAVARLVYATESDNPQELVLALEAAERAVRAAPDRPEILFNRALALEKAGLVDRSIAAWGRFLALDDASPWADEARSHVKLLRSPGIPERWRALRPELDRAALFGDAAAVQRIVALAPQDAREAAIEEVLGRWGELIQTGDLPGADRELRIASAIGDVLEREVGDPTVTHAVNALHLLAAAPNSSRLAQTARGHIAYRDGIAHFRRQELEDAEPNFATAFANLAPIASPVALWARHGNAGCALYRSRYAEAEAELAKLTHLARARGYPALLGRIEWALGLASVRQGRFEQALRHDLAAVDLFSNVRERHGLAAVHGLLAEDLGRLGQVAVAWHHRFRALRELAGDRDSLRLHNVLWQCGHAAVVDGAPLAALQFQNEGLAVDRRAGEPRRIAESLIWRSKIHLAKGDPGSALADLALARSSTAAASGSWARERVEIDIDFAEGKARRRIDPVAALRPTGRALAYYRQRSLALDLADALLSGARMARAVGNGDAARSYLNEAIELFEQQRGLVGERAARFSFSDTVEPVFDERIRLEVETANDPEAAFLLSERARSVPWGGGVGALPVATMLAAIQGAIPKGAVLLEYALVEDQLYLWKVTHQDLVFVSRAIDRGRLDRSIARFVYDLRTDAPEDRWRARSAWLRELLLPAALEIPRDAPLLVIPDKVLNAIPFAALRAEGDGRYLIEEHEITFLPSASYLLGRRSQRAPRVLKPLTALLVSATEWDRRIYADLEPLPAARDEVREIAGIYPGSLVLSGTRATTERVRRELPLHSIVHFAGHALVSAEDPGSAHLVLAPTADDPGALLGGAIARLPLDRVDLVVLGACDTLGPRNARATGLAGLARPFLDAGAASVVGTLWSVDDREASQLLTRFHRAWSRSHRPAEALRVSQVEMLRSEDPKLSRSKAWAGAQVAGRVF